MATFIPEKMTVVTMASGHLCLELTEVVGWRQFPQFADELLALLNGTAGSKADGVDLRVWRVRIRGCDLKLVYEDYPQCVSLESSTDEADGVLQEIHQELKTAYGGLK